MPAKKIILVTNNYPFGGVTEEAFLKSEIPVLASRFQSVVVLPVRRESQCLDINDWPQNVSLDSRLSEKERKTGRNKFLSLLNWRCLIAFIKEFPTINCKSKFHFLAESFSENLVVFRFFRQLILDGEISKKDTVIYTFWFAESAGGLGMLPHKLIPMWISRAHGYDLYDERVPFRSHIIRDNSFRNVKTVFACSKQGADYLSNQYPEWKDKISCLYLGTPAPYAVPKYEFADNSLRFLTIARLEPVKRPFLTFSFLNSLAKVNPGMTISWDVFGGGSLLEELKGMAQTEAKSNLKVNFYGETSNSVVHSYLSRQIYDWMIMLSQSEGLPISIAEALSYGIPSIATDVGGVKEEVIPGKTGILLPSNPSFEVLLASIEPFLSNRLAYLNMRETALSLWQETFNETLLKQQLVYELLKN